MENEKSVLIVEDEAFIGLWLKMILVKNAFNVVGVVSRGEDAVTLAREQRPDLILMDIGLAGEMDGVEAAKAIQGFSNTPIIFISGYAMEDILEGLKSRYAVAFLKKPFTRSELLDKIHFTLAHQFMLGRS